MAGSSVREFRERREEQNARIHGKGHLGIERFFALDARAYKPGALDGRTKELLGLACSLVLRCDDCVTYHVLRCVEEGANDDQMLDAMNVALVVGGSIVIPHLRRAVQTLDEVRAGT
jgi:AhpD family alkylhydroperoxidase